jgi:hypothetical protein
MSSLGLDSALAKCFFTESGTAGHWVIPPLAFCPIKLVFALVPFILRVK